MITDLFYGQTTLLRMTGRFHKINKLQNEHIKCFYADQNPNYDA